MKGFAPHDIVCFTDGACIGNPGPCGAGAYVKFPDGETKRSVALGSGTNNIAELYAVGLAMDLLREAKEQGRRLPSEAKVHVLTDSNYTKGMLALDHNARSNHELIATVKSKIAKVCQHNPVFIHWIGAHSNIAGNEQADQLAMQGAKNSQAGVQIVHPLAQKQQKPTSTPPTQQQRASFRRQPSHHRTSAVASTLNKQCPKPQQQQALRRGEQTSTTTEHKEKLQKKPAQAHTLDGSYWHHQRTRIRQTKTRQAASKPTTQPAKLINRCSATANTQAVSSTYQPRQRLAPKQIPNHKHQQMQKWQHQRQHQNQYNQYHKQQRS